MTESPAGDANNWQRVYPFASHWAEVAGGRVHYVDEGPGKVGTSHHDASALVGGAHPTLLFVHGNPTWSFHWRRLVEALRARYRCVAVDHLGCGLSDKPQRLLTLDDHIKNLCELVEKLKLDRVTLIAQDWGGAIGLGAMLRMPQQLERIVLFNTGAFPPRYIPWRIRACRWPVVGRLAVQGANAFSRAALRMTLSRKSRLEPDVAVGYLAPYDSWANRCAVYGFVKDIPSGPGEPTWQTLSAIEHGLPTLADRPSCLIWGMRDWCFRPDCLDRFVEAWQGAEVHRLAEVGHWVVEDAPEESLAIVESFLVKSAEDLPRRHEGHEERNVTST
jgi:pimeloyl-ACP methyl ester carboxylesterase